MSRYAFSEQEEIGDGVVQSHLKDAATMTRKRTEGLVTLNVQGPGVHTAHTATSIVTIRETEQRIITMTKTNTTSLPKVVDESEVAASPLNIDVDLPHLRQTLLHLCHLRSVVAVVGIGCGGIRQVTDLILVRIVAMFASPSQSIERKIETRSTRNIRTGIMERTKMKGAAF